MTINFNNMEMAGPYMVQCDCGKEQFWGNFPYYSQDIQILANKLPCPGCPISRIFTVSAYMDGRHTKIQFLNFKVLEWHRNDRYFWVPEEEIIKNKKYIKKENHDWVLNIYNPFTRTTDRYKYPSYQDAKREFLGSTC